LPEWDLLSPGAVVADKYRVVSRLAKGGFATVYVAEHLTTEKRLAVKMLLPHILRDEKSVRDFKFEATIDGKVDSEHLAQVYDAGIDERTGAPFLVMELLNGENLEQLVQRAGPLPPARVADYLLQVTGGLDKAHGYVDARGRATPIVHRDLKPENLFLARLGSGASIVKILDFGIAKVVSESKEVTEQIRGTALYMAFEQASGAKITPATDIWALGLIAFRLLTGRYYWMAGQSGDGASLEHALAEILSLPLPPASERASAIGVPIVLGSAFDGWFARCVRRNAGERFQSAGEAGRALAEALGVSQAAASAEARPPDDALAATLHAPREPRRRRAGVVAALGMGGAATLAAGALASRMWGHPGPPAAVDAAAPGVVVRKDPVMVQDAAVGESSVDGGAKTATGPSQNHPQVTKTKQKEKQKQKLKAEDQPHDAGAPPAQSVASQGGAGQKPAAAIDPYRQP
jgi:hypothetical protein